MIELWPTEQHFELLERLNIIKPKRGPYSELTDDFKDFLRDKSVLLFRNFNKSEKQEVFEVFMDVALMWRNDLPYTEREQVAMFLLAAYEETTEELT